MTFRKFFFSAFLLLLTQAVAWAAPYPSTYSALPSGSVLIVNATILTGTGTRIENGQLLLSDGKIEQVGNATLKIDADDTTIIDAKGRWVTPGLIDVHSHLGVYASPNIKAHSDGNEATAPTTAQVWAEHSVWPQDPGFNRARAGGVTSMQILPGSAGRHAFVFGQLAFAQPEACFNCEGVVFVRFDEGLIQFGRLARGFQILVALGDE